MNEAAAELLAALNIEEGMTLEEANAKGYFTINQLAKKLKGVSDDMVYRAIRKGDYESVRIIRYSALRAYRQKRKP